MPPVDYELEVLSRLMQNAPYPVVICNAEGDVVSANDAARAIYGKPREGSANKAWTKVAEVRDARGRALRPHEYPLNRALSGQVVNDEPLTVVHPDTGKTRKVRVTAHQLRDGDRLIGAVTIHRD